MKFTGNTVKSLLYCVTSYAEVWIEIPALASLDNEDTSPPTRRCGLKYQDLRTLSKNQLVTSYAEVWIEMTLGRHPLTPV